MKFLFDNNMSQPLAAALRIMTKPVVHVRDISELGPKAPDQLIMEYAGNNNFLVITRDLKQAREPWFKPTILRVKAGYFLVRGSKRSGEEPVGWDLCKLLVKAWDDIERYGTKNGVPFISLVKSNGHVSTYP